MPARQVAGRAVAQLPAFINGTPQAEKHATTAGAGRQASPRPSGPRPRRTGASCLRAPSSFQLRSRRTISRRWSTASSRRSPRALRSEGEVEARLMVGRIGRDPRLERAGLAEGDRPARRARVARATRRRPPDRSPCRGQPCASMRLGLFEIAVGDHGSAGEAGERAARFSRLGFRTAPKSSAAPAIRPSLQARLGLGDQLFGLATARAARRGGR